MAWLRNLFGLNSFRWLQKSILWQVAKIVAFSTLGFSATVAFFTYAGLLLQSFVRKQRRYRFPHSPLDPVEVDGHKFKIFNYGESTFNDMLAEIDKAQDMILLETYILKGDNIGQAFKRKLIEKAAQGVKVYIGFDGFGSLLMPFGFKRWPSSVKVCVFGPIHSYLNLLLVHSYVRHHRKILVIDGQIAYLGGMNIGREYARTWRDTHLRMDGPKAQEVALSFAEAWNRYNRTPARRLRLPYNPPHDDNSHKIYLRESRPSPIFGPVTIREVYLKAFENAKEHIKLTNPYFLPDLLMENEMVIALQRGVKLDLIVPQKSNHSIVDLLARHSYDRLVKAGACIWLYQGTVIHSKTATIDSCWNTIGSANLDGRSLINYEINIFVEDPTFARRMEEMFDDDRSNCKLADLHQFDQPSPARRFLEIIAYPLRPFV